MATLFTVLLCEIACRGVKEARNAQVDDELVGVE